VTDLRKMMLEEPQRRNYSEAATRYYVRAVERFAPIRTPNSRRVTLPFSRVLNTLVILSLESQSSSLARPERGKIPPDAHQWARTT